MNTNLLSSALKRVFGNGSVNNIASSSLVPYCNASGVPDGLSSISNLASVLGVEGLKVISFGASHNDFEQAVADNPNKILVGRYSPGSADLIIGYSIIGSTYGAFIKISYGDNLFSQILQPFALLYNGVWTYNQ